MRLRGGSTGCIPDAAVIGKIAAHPIVSVFSSPEHEVLMVSYCDQSLSVVRRPCVVNFLL